MTTHDPNPNRLERDIVNLDDPHDVEYWMRSLNISRGELERAIEIVGPSAGQVYDYIWRQRQTGN